MGIIKQLRGGTFAKCDLQQTLEEAAEGGNIRVPQLLKFFAT